MKAINTHRNYPVYELGDGYGIKLDQLDINVRLGRIEEFGGNKKDYLVALPANEYFDDKCIDDPRSALGAFMQHHFNDQIPEIRAQITTILSGMPNEEVQKSPGVRERSYGVGKCVFLQSPLQSDLQIAMIAVTTQRENHGLRADTSYIFEAATTLMQLMANNRLDRLYIPIIGSGHGGLREEVSLACMLIAFGELRRRSTYNIKEINIVVFRPDKSSNSLTSEAHIKRALSFSANLLAT